MERKIYMEITHLNNDNFNDVVADSGIVLVFCMSPYCPTCKEFKPRFEKVAAESSEHTFAVLDAINQKELASQLSVDNVPALILYRDGVMLFRSPGGFEEDKIRGILDQAAGLDMDMVRDQMAAENQNA